MKIERKVEKNKDKVIIISTLKEELDKETFDKLKKGVEYQVFNLRFQVAEIERKLKELNLTNYNKKRIERLKKDIEIIEKLKEKEKLEQELAKLKEELAQYEYDFKLYTDKEKVDYV